MNLYDPTQQIEAFKQLHKRLNHFRTMVLTHYPNLGGKRWGSWKETDTDISGNEDGFYFLVHDYDGTYRFYVPDEVIGMDESEMETWVITKRDYDKKTTQSRKAEIRQLLREIRWWKKGNEDYFTKGQDFRNHRDSLHPINSDTYTHYTHEERQLLMSEAYEYERECGEKYAEMEG